MGLQAPTSPREKCSIAVHLNWITQIRHLNHLWKQQKSTLAVLQITDKARLALEVGFVDNLNPKASAFGFIICDEGTNNALRANGNEPQLTY